MTVKFQLPIVKKITTLLTQALTELDLVVSKRDLQLEHPVNLEFGDYASNVAMQLFGAIKKPQNTLVGKKNPNSSLQQKPAATNPYELAQKIVQKLEPLIKKNPDINAVSVAQPGFINFKLSEQYLLNQLKKILASSASYAQLTKLGQNKTVVVDYSAPNIAKRFSIGHLRSTIIGQALCNLYRLLGWQVIGDNHLGDWGTQFGKMIVAVKKWAQKPVDQLSIDEMEALYVKFHQEAESEPALEDLARKAFKNLEDNQPEEKKLWQQLVETSMQEFQQIYDLLGVEIEYVYGESFYEKIMPAVIEEAQQKKIAVKSQGALVVNYPQEQLPPAMLLKSDGATTYFTRDLATIKFREQQWSPDLYIYEVGAEQSLHFKQVFWAAELLGWGKQKDFVHIAHGLIRLKQGKMSTRKGRTVKLNQVLQQAIKQAAKFNQDQRVAQVVGIGAVKYNDLKRSPSSGYT
ncbi:MAG: arginine--tRNA ligase, partial [Candidatus Pacebacteria bacterium]|nr:arginine--tRNA ligase [Candidatus Paceibacterota bacterium]